MTLEKVEAIPRLAPRARDSHKGSFGTVLVVAGSRGMAGAAALCGASALRSGAGLVRVATSAEVQAVVASFEPSYMTYPLLCDDEGLIDFPRVRTSLEKLIETASVIAVGPGLGQSPGILELVRFLITEVNKPLVLDADALNVLTGHLDLLASHAGPLIITPHPGEFARLSGKTVAEVQSDRINLAATMAAASESLIVVLKGKGTIVTDGRGYYVNTTGNPGMATGGTGDILTGVIAAMLAQKLPAFQAAELGVFIHGLAGDIARDHHGEVGMIAGDVVDALPDAFAHAMPDADLLA